MNGRFRAPTSSVNGADAKKLWGMRQLGQHPFCGRKTYSSGQIGSSEAVPATDGLRRETENCDSTDRLRSTIVTTDGLLLRTDHARCCSIGGDSRLCDIGGDGRDRSRGGETVRFLTGSAELCVDGGGVAGACSSGGIAGVCNGVYSPALILSMASDRLPMRRLVGRAAEIFKSAAVAPPFNIFLLLL